MPKFIIEREIAGAGRLSPGDLRAVTLKSCEVLDAMGPEIQWIQSFVTDDRIYCVYIAPDEKAVVEHARRGGFPADQISRPGRHGPHDRGVGGSRRWPRRFSGAGSMRKALRQIPCRPRGSFGLLRALAALLALGTAQPAVAQCTTNFTFTSSVNPSVFGQPVTFTVTVVPATLSGSAEFHTDQSLAPVETKTLVNGIADYTVADLPAGIHTVFVFVNVGGCILSRTLLQTVNSQPPTGPDLTVRLCGTAYPDAGTSVGDYTAIVTNKGSQPATGVTLSYDPPLNEFTPRASQGQCPFSGRCDLGTLAPGASATVGYNDIVLPGGTSTSVFVMGDMPDPTPFDNRASITATPVDCMNLPQACPLLSLLGKLICEQRMIDDCSGVAVRASVLAERGASPPGRLAPAAVTGSASLQAFYALRDTVFSTTPSGRRYTQLYYGYGPEVTRLILANPAIANQGLSTASMWQDAVQALVYGRGDSATISSTQTDALTTFLESLKAAGSPELGAVLSREQAALDLPSLVGKTMTQAWARQQQTAPATVTLPASASIHGLNGSFFHSDVRVLNPSAMSSANVTLRYRCFTGSCPSNVQTLTLAPREMKILDDIDGTLFGAPESAGPIEITGDVLVDSRVYTPEKPAPTTGAFVPGLTSDEALPESVLLSLSNSVDRSRGFRTNAGVYNPSGDSLSVTFSLFDPTGKPIGQTSRNVGPLSAIQVNDLFGSSGISTDVDNAYCVVKAEEIHELYAYATVIDNQSQDQVFIRGRNARGVPSGTLTLPAAASIHGLNGAFFHSDVRVFNPSSNASSTVTATYRCFIGSCLNNVQTFTLAPREMKVFDDIVGTLFNAPESAGPIEFTGNALVDSRVYSPAKPAPTTGDDVPGLTEDESSQQAVLTSLARSADPSMGFRTNVGVYNPGSLPLTVTFSIYAPSGRLLGQATRQFAGQTAIQITDIFGAAGIAGDVPNAYCVVSGDGIATPFGLGKLFAYATVIDNRSQDTTFVVGRPLGAGPAGVGSRAQVASTFGAVAGVFIPFIVITGAIVRRREQRR